MHLGECIYVNNSIQLLVYYSILLSELLMYFNFLHFTEFIEGTARITEARLNREQSEGRIIYYNRVGDSGFRVVPKGAFTSWEHKV